MPKFQDLTGYVNEEKTLKVLERLEDHIYPSGKTRPQYKCLCLLCGNTFTALGHKITSGHTKSCGCLRGIVIREKKGIDYKGQHIGALTVIKRLQGSDWLCKCDCGNEYITNTSLLTRSLKGEFEISCGAWYHKTEDLTNKQFGYLTVLKRIKSRNITDATWVCRCKCGKYKVVSSTALRHLTVKSCGCAYESRLEMILEKLLQEQSIEYSKQIKFGDLRGYGNGMLSYDFLLKYNGDDVCFIECQGQQHYRPVDIFGGEEQFEVQQLHDELKREYAFEELHVPLIEIPYTSSEDDIREMLEPGGSIWEFVDCYKRSK